MSSIYPYLAFHNAKEALAYYEGVFGAEIVSRVPVSEEQGEVFGIAPEALANTTMHAEFRILGATLYAADNFGKAIEPSNQISLMLTVDSNDAALVKQADEFYTRLLDSGEVTITMPYEEQFWGDKMGSFTDRFGIGWMLHASAQA